MEALTKDYINDFESDAYLNTYFKDPKQEPKVLQCLHKFWSQPNKSDLRVLEYGGGPNISRLISACPHVKEFVFAEYAKHLRQDVQAWIDKDPKAFDWKDTFDYVIQELEGKGPEEVAKREDELRQKIRAIIPCDIKAENILEIPADLGDKYGPPYDVVATSLCLEAAVESEQEYKDTVAKLAKLVKPGGYLMMHAVLRQTFYMVGSKKFYSFYLTAEMMKESMKNAGATIMEIDTEGKIDSLAALADSQGELFICGRL